MRAKILFIVCITAIVQTQPCKIRCIKPRWLVSIIMVTGYMLYNDYQYTLARYNAFKAEHKREQLLYKIAHNPQEISPHPSWWIAQYQQIIAWNKIATEHQNKALISRSIGYLYSKCKR